MCKDWTLKRWNMLTRRINHMVWWVRHRTTDRFHRIDTGLPPGWYEADVVILHTNFQILMKYVDIECAHMASMIGDTYNFASANKGVQYLMWEASLHMEPDGGYGDENLTPQARSSREILALYNWWCNRLCDEDFFKTICHLPFREQNILSDQREEEDTGMLIRLIKIRNCMWT